MSAANTPNSPAFDLFLSYNRQDQAQVDEARDALTQRGLVTFLDHLSLTVGLPWPEALERALNSARGVAVFLGPHGLGGWQRREMFFALDRQVAAAKIGRTFPVIPVLLAGADLSPSFLLLNSWVDLRRVDDAVAYDVLVRAVSGIQPAAPPVIDPRLIRPYAGLRPFTEENSGFFFGRDAFVERLFERITHDSIVPVVGASGSGKSSVVLAGLIPRLRRQRPPQTTWEVVSFTPGGFPWRRFADALMPLLASGASANGPTLTAADLERDLMSGAAAMASAVERTLKASGGANRLLVVIDQFEELFTTTPDADRARFLSQLLNALMSAPFRLVFTLRADFYGRALDGGRTISDALGAGAVAIGPLLPDEVRRVIEQPLFKVGGSFEAGLAETLLADVLSQPGSLPLLEYVLTELWDRCTLNLGRGQRIEFTFDAYQKSGGLRGAIAQRADGLFEALTDGEKRAARRLFGQLVRVTRGGEEGADTRRRARKSEVGDAGWAVAQRFAGEDYRLLVIADGTDVDDPTVEVAHEAVIQHWTRLQKWVEEDRSSLAVAQHLSDSYAEWQRREQAEPYLLEGPALGAAEDWAATNWNDISIVVRDFLVRSVICKGRPLADWVVRYAECADVLALAREYLQAADDVQRRRRGLDVLRWAPASDMRINGTIIRIAIDDSDAGVRRYAVETLCGRDAVGALWEALANTTERGLRRRLSQAIGHARNLRGVGRRALAGVGLTDRLRVRMRSAVDLLALYRTAFAVTFALTALLFEVGTELYRFMHIIVRSVVASGSDGGLSLSYAFSETAIAITAVVGLGALLRRIIDERAAEPERWDLMRAGIIGGAISELIQIVARLAQETVNTFVRLAQGHVGISPTNFLFAFTDTLYTIAAMGVIALALKPIAAAPPRKTLMWRFAGFALLASVAGIVTSRLLLPLAYNLSGMNFRFEPSLETFVGEMLVSLLVSTVAGAAGLVGFRLALRIAFDDQAFPAWSVPEPNSTGRSDRMRRRSPVQCE